MKKIIILTFIISLASNLLAQIGGLSASKLSAFSSSVVSLHKIEFEPSFTISYYSTRWNKNSEIIHNNATIYENAYNFRFTYGAVKNLEMGFLLPCSVNSMAYGIKYLFYQKQILSFALISGLNFDFNNKYKTINQFGSGIITTINYSQNFSSDLDLQITKNYDENNYIFQSTFDTGIYLKYVQYILETQFKKSLGQKRYLLSISPGTTIEPAKNFLLVLSYNIPLLGKDTERIYAFSFALTITLE